MGKAWVKRWSPHRNGGKGSLVPVLSIHRKTSIEKMQWSLPPSKSHAIRWLTLAAQSQQEVVLRGMEHAGQDVISMRRCLVQMGVSVSDLDRDGQPLTVSTNDDDQPANGTASWKVTGVGPNGLHPPISVLHAGNSGTSLRILMALVSLHHAPVMVDGDASLRSRSYNAMLSSFEQLGVACSKGTDAEGLPFLIQGPINADVPLHLDVGSSSQPTTAWCLAAPGFSSALEVHFEGDPVSRRHAALTMEMCEATGSGPLSEGALRPWQPTFPTNEVIVPRDCSMLGFAFLAVQALQSEVLVEAMPLPEDSLGHELLFDIATSLGITVSDTHLKPTPNAKRIDIDLRDANDLITPLAATLALGAGGLIHGAPHAAHKETNRLTGTVSLLKQFGLESNVEGDGLRVPGGQRLSTPTAPVQTYSDHRMQMTALILAAACEEEVLVEGPSLHTVADPDAVERLRACGVEIEARLHQPW
ncbi:MAG: 3-phosphoshikimate 1-carboxyvinyltransferase [Poseidonia sp.]|jgi:3-phosphoshikimate 1-carboxyvinyltransferase